MSQRPHSGLQKQVLALYRAALRVARSKPETRGQMEAMARQEFRKHQHLGRADVSRIEYLIRRGRKQLNTIMDPNVSAVSSRASTHAPKEEGS